MSRRAHPTDDRDVYQTVILSLLALGLMLLVVGIKAPVGVAIAGYVFVGMAVVAKAVLLYNSVTNGPGKPPHAPPAASPPCQPQPAPLPGPDLVQTRSGHKPANRELPADRPHPWRTWGG